MDLCSGADNGTTGIIANHTCHDSANPKDGVLEQLSIKLDNGDTILVSPMRNSSLSQTATPDKCGPRPTTLEPPRKAEARALVAPDRNGHRRSPFPPSYEIAFIRYHVVNPLRYSSTPASDRKGVTFSLTCGRPRPKLTLRVALAYQ
eukprot:365904-Chlamydomonas_euryale.AAC.3